ncbi:hypothetical protein [Streptomyces mirabilis]|uniref:hypothetical protein n=1 Tax=Streptomyces mirabilis TaxID=68239 RepID=UPI00368E56E1
MFDTLATQAVARGGHGAVLVLSGSPSHLMDLLRDRTDLAGPFAECLGSSELSGVEVSTP